MNIKIVKMVTGEEVLSNVDEDGDNITLSQPMVLIMQQDGLQMVPWLMLAAKPEVTISKDKIIMIYEARNELVIGYQQQTGGIVTAPANALDPKGKLIL